MTPTAPSMRRLTNLSFSSLWSLFASGSAGIVAGLVILAIIFVIGYVVLSFLASLFGVIPFVLGFFVLICVWIMWTGMSDESRDAYGKYLWLVPFVIWGVGAAAHSAGLLQMEDLSLMSLNQEYSVNIGGGLIALGLIGFMYLAFFVIVVLIVLAKREDFEED